VIAKSGDKWVVASKYNAPAKKDKVEEFLGKVKHLEGEGRPSSADVLEDFKLSEKKALHVRVAKKGGEGAWLHLLVGAKEKYGNSFVRLDGSEDVYTVDVNFASEMGIWGDDDTKAPEAGEWLNKDVLKLKKDDIVSLAITTPDREVVFERREVEKTAAPEPKPGEEKPAAKPKEKKWFLVSGGVQKEKKDFKQAGIDAILRAFENYSASDVEDPAKKAELGLDAPNFKCVAKTAGGEQTVVVASLKEPGQDAYVMVEGRNVIYKVATWRFDDLFAKGKDLFDLKATGEDKAKIASVAYEREGAKITFKRKAPGTDEWTMSPGFDGLELKSDKVKNLVSTVAAWKPDDYVDEGKLPADAFKKVFATATFTVEGGASHTITIGGPARAEEGRYAKLDGAGRVWVMSKYDTERVAPEAKEFFDLEVVDIAKDDIASVTCEGGGTVTKVEIWQGGSWQLFVNGSKIEASTAGIDGYAGRFSSLKADDVALAGGTVTVERTVTVKTNKGATTVFRFGPAEDGKRLAKIDGVGAPVAFKASDADRLWLALRDVADRTVVDLASDKIAKVEVKRAQGAFTLAKDGEAWKLTAGETKDADVGKASAYLRNFSPLRSVDVLVGADAAVANPAATVTITDAAGEATAIAVGREKDGKVALRVGDAKVAYLVTKAKAAALTPDAKALLPAAAAEIPME
jgi:hypothetical protein